MNIRGNLSDIWDSTLTFIGLRITDWLGTSHLANRYLRPAALRLLGFQIGRGGYYRPGIVMQFKRKNLVIGQHTNINYGCYFDAVAPIKIGDYCQVGSEVSFIQGSHERDTNKQGVRPAISSGPMVIEDYVWIGARATILPGVRIGRGSVIAAGALVTSDIPPDSLALGIPAKVVKKINQ